MSGEEQAIRRLNAEYIRAFLESDVDWFDGHLADDFMFINGAGAIIDQPPSSGLRRRPQKSSTTRCTR